MKSAVMLILGLMLSHTLITALHNRDLRQELADTRAIIVEACKR